MTCKQIFRCARGLQSLEQLSVGSFSGGRSVRGSSTNLGYRWLLPVPAPVLRRAIALVHCAAIAVCKLNNIFREGLTFLFCTGTQTLCEWSQVSFLLPLLCVQTTCVSADETPESADDTHGATTQEAGRWHPPHTAGILQRRCSGHLSLATCGYLNLS